MFNSPVEQSLYIRCVFKRTLYLNSLYYPQVCQFPVYAGAIKVVEDILTGNNVEVTWVDSNESVAAFEKAIKPTTKVGVYLCLLH